MRSKDNSDLSFEYRFRWTAIFLTIAIFSVVGMFFVFKLASGAPRFIVGDLIYLSGRSAAMAYGGFGSGFLLIATFVTGFAFRMRSSPPAIQINSRRVRIPRSTFSREFISINFSEVESLKNSSRGTQRLLSIRHKRGTTRISERMAGSPRNYEELVRLIEKFSQESSAGKKRN